MIHALYEGTFSVGWDKAFHPIERDGKAAQGALKISLNPFLIQTRTDAVLIDCGLGDYGIRSHIPILERNLQAHGLTPADISAVICSHLHWDHIGGLAHRKDGSWTATFPNASVWMCGAEWDKVRFRTGEEDVKRDFIDALESVVDVRFLRDGDSPRDGITTEVIGGHTEHSLGIWLDLPGMRYLMAGDVIGTRGSLARRYAAKYDFDGRRAQEQRDRLSRICVQEGFGLLCYHDNHMPVLEPGTFDPTP
jgi:glyoxylase-like metal-dependent hydrolase (beta-lactamase superfamily II)